MNGKVRKVLDVLDRELTGKGPNRLSKEEQHKLWDVLTALRGPDSQEHSEKSAVTIPVRRAALPRTAKAADKRADNSPTGASFSGWFEAGETAEGVRRGLSGHFEYHGRVAFTALGLDW